MEVRVKQESQDEALVPFCGKSTNGSNGNSSSNNINNNNSLSVNGSGGNNPQLGPMQKVLSLSDLSDPESSLETLMFLDCICGSTMGELGLLGLCINEHNVALLNQTLETLTEYCQGPCHKKPELHRYSRVEWIGHHHIVIR
ncbi:hypothetical protein DAPPUDRAFT_95625 [Daphnia pulex]|uniref:RyR/IP3R Homology associated domain-containing protein n=1 Tax=Daphnia pulex TaxID=6669 RepID=E9FW92_DAPPU|nr:hypothetical protein DAPPUDRAFT_95625 [Daphnia pulex]|eukprot:EFX88966.1 hypothetical protein DAPPUDRAFT_95625 [Daphnia pulex]